MKCPNCNVNLTMSERQGVEIDYCPDCRGVWLDRGELDKIIEKTSRENTSIMGRHDVGTSSQPYYGNDKYHYKKKKSILGELFDF